MAELIIPAIVSCIVAFFTVYFVTPPLIQFLQKRNLTVKDMNKKDHVMVVRPGGPSIIPVGNCPSLFIVVVNPRSPFSPLSPMSPRLIKIYC